MISICRTKKDAENLFSALKMDMGGKILIITKNTEYKDFIVQEGLKRLGTLLNTSVLSMDEFYLRYAKGSYKFLSDLSMRLIIKKIIEMNKDEMEFLSYPSYMDLIFEAIKDASKKDIDLLVHGGEYKKIYEDYESLIKEGGYLGMNDTAELDPLKIKNADAIYFIGFNEINKKLSYLIDMSKKLDKNTKIFIEEDFASDDLMAYLKENADEVRLDEDNSGHFEKLAKKLFNEEIIDTDGINFVRADSVEAELDYALTDIKEKVLKEGYAYGDALIYLMDKSEEISLTEMLNSYEIPINKNSVFNLKDIVWQEKLYADILANEFETNGVTLLEMINKYTADEMLLDKFEKIIAAIEEIYGKAISKETWIDLLKIAFKYEVYREKDRVPFGVSIYTADFDTLRHYKLIYIVGANMDNFPKTMSENFLLDNIYDEIGYDKSEYMSRLSKNLMKKLIKATDEKLTISYSAKTLSDSDQGASSLFNEFYIFDEENKINKWIVLDSLNAIEKSPTLATNPEQKKYIEAYKGLSKTKYPDYDEINKLRNEGEASKYNGKFENYSTMSKVDEFLNNGFSVSFLGAYDTCPYSALLGYIYGIEPAEVDMKARNIGTYMHKVLEIYYSNFIGKKVIYDEALLEKTMELIKKTNEYADVYGFELENIETYIKDFIIYDEERMKKSNYVVKELEKKIKIYVDGYEIRGKIDRADEDTLSGKLLLIDYKKSSSTKTHDSQLISYSLYYKPSGVDIDAAFIGISKFDDQIETMAPIQDDAEEIISEIISGVKSYNFPIIKSGKKSDCPAFCEFKNICKRGREWWN